MKAVFIRLDKIGDLIATLPIDQLPALKNEDIHWVLAEGLGSIVKNAVPERKFSELSLKDEKKSFKKLREILREQKPEAVVCFYGPWWIGLAAFLERVPVRIARRSQWHSFIFFNRGFRQSRSLSEMHEADYNRELVEKGLKLSPATATPILELNPPSPRHLLEKWNIRTGEYFIVHPGMWGSALNWPQAHYSILIEKLINAGPVMITGTEADMKYLGEIQAQWQHDAQVRWAIGSLSLTELLSLLKAARAVVAPSTGVLHMAASCGTKCVGIYSPITSQHPRRWGPRGPQAKALAPQTDGENCMETITVNQVLKELQL